MRTPSVNLAIFLLVSRLSAGAAAQHPGPVVAARRGGPWINLQDGRDLAADYSAPSRWPVASAVAGAGRGKVAGPLVRRLAAPW